MAPGRNAEHYPTGSQVVLTDPGKPLNYALGLEGNTLDCLEANVARNAGTVARGGGAARASKLLWDDEADITTLLREQTRHFDLLFGADLMRVPIASPAGSPARCLQRPARHPQVVFLPGADPNACLSRRYAADNEGLLRTLQALSGPHTQVRPRPTGVRYS